MLLKITLLILDITGMNPLNERSFAKVRHFTFCVGLAIFTIGICGGTVQFYEGMPTLVRMSDGLPGALQAMWKAGMMTIRRKDLAAAVRQIQTFWKCEMLPAKVKTHITSIANRSAIFLKLYYTICVFIVIRYYGSPAIMGTGQLPLIFFMEGIQPYHTYMYVFLACFGMPCGLFMVGFEGLFLFYAVNAIVEFRIIRYVFQEELESRRFEENIRHHRNLIQFVKNISDFYQYTFMTMIFTTFCYICFSLFLMTSNGMPPSVEDVSKYGALVGLTSLQIAMYCFIGQLLVDESVKIADVLFYKDWSSMESYRNAFDRMIIMRTSQKGQYLTVGGFFVLDLQTYTWIMRSVYSFFTFMQGLSKKN